MNRVLLVGATGMLGSEVLKFLKKGNFDYVAPSSSDLDITNRGSVFKFVATFKPGWIINCAAWTDVDAAEELSDYAFELNTQAVRSIGEAADLFGSKVIHISTDYVFSGASTTPYDELSSVDPLNRYGESKALGEKALAEVLVDFYIVRTSWLYGKSGKNFVKTISSKALEKKEINVVADQVGSPTSARDLAGGILSIVNRTPNPGIYNYSNNGSCSWFEFAQSIYSNIGVSPLLVNPIDSASLAQAAKRPGFSLLSKDKWNSMGLSSIPPWKDSLELILPEIVTELMQSEKS